MNMANIGEAGSSSEYSAMPSVGTVPCWSQVTPQFMPWGHTPTQPAAPLVTFTARPPSLLRPQAGGSYSPLALHCKRKASQDMPTSSAKQLVTEERMAAHMSRLHISSESPTAVEHTACTEEGAATREQRLYVCEEMRRLQTESILPQSLLGRIQRPCMAVMLWQPPPKIPDLIVLDTPSVGPRPLLLQQEDDNDNNNSSSVDLNNMEMDT